MRVRWYYALMVAVLAAGILAQVILNTLPAPGPFMFVVAGMMAVGIAVLVVLAQGEYVRGRQQ